MANEVVESDSSVDSQASGKKCGRKVRRRRMTAEQTAAMEVEWQRNLAWTSSRISSIAKRLGLGRTKVYKWTWDRKKKESIEIDAGGAVSSSGAIASEEAVLFWLHRNGIAANKQNIYRVLVSRFFRILL